jgi:hypothetical protein
MRLTAGLIDAAALIGGIGAAVGLGIGVAIMYPRVRGKKDHEDRDENGGPSDTRATKRRFHQSSQLHAALRGASSGLVIAFRNSRGPGFRAVGLRRVDARTGGPVSVRSALIGQAFDQACQAATKPPFDSRAQRRQDRLSALEPQIKAVKRQHTDDPQAQQQAVMEFFKANNVQPFTGCGWMLARPVISQLVLAAGSRDGRTVRDRITGTAVIVDR